MEFRASRRHKEGSVQVDREDVMEDDGSESREGAEERSERIRGSAKKYMPMPEDPVPSPEKTKLTKEKRDTKMDMKETSPEPQCSFHGILRYRRESDWGKSTPLVPSSTDHTVWCEFCGAKAKPLVEFLRSPNPENLCCPQYMEMFKKVEQQWRLLQEHSGESGQEHDADTSRATSPRLQTNKRLQMSSGKREQKRQASAKQTEFPGCRVTSYGLLTSITFRLSEFLRAIEYRRSDPRENNVREEMPNVSKLCSTHCSFPAGFGLCHYQGHKQKFYSDGTRFLTALPDGTTQVCYPSGNLAIITFVDDTVGVCVVLDDVSLSCPVRAFFLSSGIATCYHSNGSTWLHTDAWGGLSLNEDRSRIRKWSWMDDTKKPRPFKPINLSLNKNIGVRVRRRESTMVTFLASGQQARFNVSNCMKPGEPAPPRRTEEVILQVSQLNARLALERLRWCLTGCSDTQHTSLRIPRTLASEGRRLLRLSSGMRMDEKDRAYIQHCLRDCQ